MPDRKPATWKQYAAALGITALALFVSCVFLEPRTPFLPCIAAVLVATWIGGRGAGTGSAAIVFLFSAYTLFFRARMPDPKALSNDIMRELIFVVVAAAVIAITGVQRRAETRARAQGEWLNLTLANMTNGVIAAWQDGRVAFMNPMARRLTGWGDEALGMHAGEVLKLLDPETGQPLENPLIRALREGTTARLEKPAWLLSRDGQRRTIEDSATSAGAPKGISPNAVLVFRDVTEQQSIEAELRSTAERFRLALEAGKLIPWEWNILTDEIISDELNDLFPPGIRHTRENYVKSVHPDDRAAMQSALEKAMENKAPFECEYRCVLASGEVRWMESRGRFFCNERGLAERMLGISRNITEQKLVDKIVREGQEQFRSVAESATDGFITVDDKGKIVYANGACAAIFGYSRAEMIGQYLFTLIPESLRKKQVAALEQYLKSGRKTIRWSRIEVPGWHKDGIEIPVELSLSETHIGQRRLFTAIVRDVSERKVAELLVEAARERLLLAQRIAGVGTYEWQVRTGKAIMSPESEALYGLKHGEFRGMHEHWGELLHPDDYQAQKDHIRKLLASAATDYNSEYRVVWPDKSIHWIVTKAKIFRNPRGEAVSILGAEQDITRQKEEEAEREQLLHSALAARERLILAQRIAGIGTYEWDVASGRMNFSPELEALYGLAPATFGGLYEYRAALVHPGDWPRMDEGVRKAIDSGAGEYDAVFRVVWPDKSVRWIASKAKIFRDEKGVAQRMLGAEQDITSQKLAEVEREKLLASEQLALERLALAQRAAGIGTFERNLQTGETKMTPEMEALFGLPAGGFGGKYENWVARMHPEDRQKALDAIDAATRENSDYYVEYRALWPDGSLHWLGSSGRVICDSQGKPELSVGACIDITQRKSIEAERERIFARDKAARAEAERASQLKDEFLATVSHELRTPLTAILGWARMLLEDSLDAETSKRGLESIERNARAQAQLVEDLLDVSRIISGRMRMQMKPIEFSEVVASSVDGVSPAALAKKISIELKLDPVRVSGDVERLQQVVFNLLFNAVKFSNRGGRVEVRVVSTPNAARLIVRDHGKGIASEFLPHLFQRFSQEDASSTRRHGGMGLGLAIVRHLVELHGGTVKAESEGEGKGSTMSVELPILKSGDTGIFERPFVPGVDSRKRPISKPRPQLQGLRVLFIEDNEDTRNMVAAVLRHAGSVVIEAASAEQALDLFFKEKPDIILSDIALPGEDGAALMGKIRALPASMGGSTPSIALTAHARPEDTAKLLAAGFQNYLAKPANPADIMEALSRVLPKSA